jgi:dihydroneopterin aldolase
MECIELKKMIFYAYHGATEQERIVGNTFRVDLKIFLDLSIAIGSDKLENTLNYADIYNLVKEEMATPSHLLEHIAGRIVGKIKLCYPDISTVHIRLAKINPPVGGELKEAAIIISS